MYIMLNYYLGYIGFEIFKKITNIAKMTRVIYYNDFHLIPIDEKISVSSLPREDYKGIVTNFDIVIGFMEPSEYGSNDVNWIKEIGIKYYNIPVTDYTAPDIEDYKKLFKIFDEHPNKKILIHCYAGKGRSNCGVSAYLMYKYNMSSIDAINHVKKCNKRSSMNRWQLNSLHSLDKIINRNITDSLTDVKCIGE